MKTILVTAALLAASPALAYEDSARPEAIIGFFSPLAPTRATQYARHNRGGVLASWYGGGERLNRQTASGEVFRPSGLTAAHRTLPLGTLLEVSYQGRTVVVRVNDRGPAAWTGRSLDLSRGAAARLGFIGQGQARVAVAVLN